MGWAPHEGQVVSEIEDIFKEDEDDNLTDEEWQRRYNRRAKREAFFEWIGEWGCATVGFIGIGLWIVKSCFFPDPPGPPPPPPTPEKVTRDFATGDWWRVSDGLAIGLNRDGTAEMGLADTGIKGKWTAGADSVSVTFENGDTFTLKPVEGDQRGFLAPPSGLLKDSFVADDSQYYDEPIDEGPY